MHQKELAPGRYFYRAASLYEPGDRVLPGAWGRLVHGMGIRHLQFYREYAWERIREARHPQRPSRMRSAFAFETLEGAERFRREGFPELIYTVDLGSEPLVHRADMTWFDRANAQHSFRGIDDCADHYWRGEILDPVNVELVVQGELVIVSRVTQIPEDEVATPESGP